MPVLPTVNMLDLLGYVALWTGVVAVGFYLWGRFDGYKVADAKFQRNVKEIVNAR